MRESISGICSADFNPENGRMEQFRIKGTGVTLNLAKNPAGFNQNISAVMQDQAPKDIIIAINDNAQDGTDISWLWDVDFDLLGNDSVKSYYCKRYPLSGYASAAEICGYPVCPRGRC